ncbi:MAG TPA: sulfatase-like hydrolase/transferase, partial [Thermoanaerobaculia bacterium]|nr:sulfatase-like hydrolase/transferase [Thermoanaerobaculia bacterium]
SFSFPRAAVPFPVPFARPFRLPPLFAVTALAAACGKGPGAPSRAAETFPAAPVVVISVDTLRSDHLPFYGYKGVETPALSSLRADSILFEKAYSHAPLTLPSHASLFTGRVPGEHGLHDNLGYHLRRDVPTLAELLKKGGYATGGAVSCYVLKGDSGVGRGFDLYDDEVDAPEGRAALGRVQRVGPETEKRLEAWIGAQSGKPLFAFLHLYEPHTPYEPPEPFKTRYASVPYDGEIAAADQIVGTFISFLKQKGIYEKALVVFLSDHGEGLGDHGEGEHGMFLYREALQVPLLVKLPGGKRAGTSVATPVALSDVFTTVGRGVALAGFQPPEGTVSLVDLAAGAPPVPRRLLAETFFPRIHFGWSELTSLIEGRWHYIEAPRPEIYDLETDPSETKNRLAEKPDALRALRADLLKRKPSYETPLEIDSEARKKLASLGYLSAGPSPAGTLDDPKDRIKTFEQLRTGLGELTGGRQEKAVEIFSRLLDENPRMLDVWDMKSRALLELGRTQEALNALEKTLEIAPEAARAPYVVEVANMCLQLGKWDDGLRHAEALRLLGDPAAEDIAARAALGKGDYAAADAAARKAVESGKGKARVRGYLVRGRIAVMRNDLEAAKTFSEKAEELSKGEKLPQSGLHMLRGDVLARSGRPAEAEKEFLEELRLYPDRVDARVSLAALYASVNRRKEARRVVIDMVSRQPSPESFLLGMKTFHSTEDPEGETQLRLEARRLFPKDPRFAAGATSSSAARRPSR